MKNIEMVFSIKTDEGTLVNNIAKSAGKAPDALT